MTTQITQANPITVPLSEERERELLKDAQSYIYQIEDGVELMAHVFTPAGHQPQMAAPVILFLHGGMWDVSMPTQFAPHCMHFASRGMVAVTVEYRVASKHNATPEDAMDDAQMAMLWLRHNHETLGVDPNRIIVAGAASGAHMALSLAMLPEVLELDGFTARPLGVIALSALVNTGKKSPEHHRFTDPKKAHKQSPLNMLRKGLPPTLLVHGKADTIVPFADVSKFARLMKRKKNPCELIEFEAMNHSFFNFNVSAKHFEITLNSMDAFLANLDCLEPMEYI